MAAQNSTETESPRRAAIACVSCAKTKTRCDRRHPCGRCRAKGLTCVSRSSRRGKAGKTSGIVTITLETSPTGSPNAASNAVMASSSLHTFYPSSPATRPQPHQPWTAASVGPASQHSEEPREAARGHSDSPVSFAMGEVNHPTTNNPSTCSMAHDHHPDGSSIGMDTNGWDTSSPSLGWLFRDFPHPLDATSQEVSGAAHWPGANNNCTQSAPILDQATSPPSDQGFEDAWMVNLEHWSVCRCCPAAQHPATDTGKSSIAAMEQNFARPGAWSDIVLDWRVKNFEPPECFTNLNLSNLTREWLLMVAQRLMHVAMDCHALNPNEFGPSEGYIRLPPSHALQNYLEMVLRNFEPFYPLIPARAIDQIILTGIESGQGSSLLLFLMLAFGSMIDPALKARQFSAGLTEICRHSITNLLEKNSDPAESRFTAYCGLMFTVKSAFSGDKAHMNISIAQRQMHLTFMRSAGMFRLPRQPVQTMMTSSIDEDIEQRFDSWRERQCGSRLSYCWVMLEHEISLFYGCQPALNISELEAALPADDSLWLASTASEWHKATSQMKSTSSNHLGFDPQSEISLFALFQLLREDSLAYPDCQPQLLHMRLLLYPIHVLITELSHLLGCVQTSLGSRSFSGPVTQASSILRFNEVQILLQRWYDIVTRLVSQSTRFRAMRNATMLLYHLTSLNLYTAFHEIELLARKGHSEADSATAEAWLRNPEHVLVHCGQAIRLFGEIEDEFRPIWNPFAVYRVTMTLWAFSIWASPCNHAAKGSATSVPQLAINGFQMNEPLIQLYLRSGHAEPNIVTKHANRISIDDPEAILSLGIDMLYHGPLTTPLSFGVRTKLKAVSRLWKEYHRDLRSRRSS
ncbi:hypothetical protein T440DRAFT_473745 [Plenodomus tracheiphilus IPT5]|uniref:Zn(2)-C6 fungal-type domain-containing protein n=1 Tax=Plenodomus tracheiphilus IPT5 TaxID=1408161 RepID=A0A6A7ANV7_9PLEO|nr:hypothetical protein T440DRAFT_473745 [Plenodomus tracheiphilus IPT5]